MNKSDDIKELATALSKFIGEIKNVEKTAKSHHGSYAELGAILDVARPELAKHGLSVLQLPNSADDSVSVETVLMHESGQWVSESLTMQLPKANNRAQAAGSIITYARRYSLASVLGIAPTDDDMRDKDANQNTVESLGLGGVFDGLVDLIECGYACLIPDMMEKIKASDKHVAAVVWKTFSKEHQEEILSANKDKKEG